MGRVPDSGPTIVAFETDSAWMVVIAVSVVTFVAAALLRRLIARPGGFASGLLLLLPLVVPVVAAVMFRGAAFPEIAVLRPVAHALRTPGELLHWVFVSDGHSNLRVPYVVTGTAGTWIFFIGIAFSSFMLLRRFVGALLLRRLIRKRCVSPASIGRGDVEDVVDRLVRSSSLKRPPTVHLLPPGVEGAFAVGLRRPAILLSQDLLQDLDADELEAILAHEVAHVEARDVQMVFTAGMLRDLLTWNPFAHVAYRRLSRDREIEADRRATTLTARPLSLASGLLKVCERMDRQPKAARRMALGVGTRGTTLTRRVSHLIAISDGIVAPASTRRLPYLFAACLVAVLGLQAGARIAAQDPTVYLISLGKPYAPEQAQVWVPGRSAARADGQAWDPAGGRRHLGHPARYLHIVSGIALREKDITRWFRSLKRIAARSGIPAKTLQWQLQPRWQAEPALPSSVVGPITILRMQLEDFEVLPQ